MVVLLTDTEITSLVSERKTLPQDFYLSGNLKPKRGHRERDFALTGVSDSKFLLILRQSLIDPLDFSAILGYQPPKASRIFRLRRYNGRSHEHTNKIERQTFYDFHIHFASERYQQVGLAEDAFAEVTRRYSDFTTALDCLLLDCGCETSDIDPRLF